MSKVIVTGGTGHIGCSLVLALLSHGHHVQYTGWAGENILPQECEYIGSSLDDVSFQHLHGCEALYHLAASVDTTVKDKKYMLKVNVEQPRRLFLRAALANVPNVVAASSAAIYGDQPCPFKEEMPAKPLNIYAHSKLKMEAEITKLAERYPQTSFVALRFCNVYGPYEKHKKQAASMVYRLREQMLQGDPILFQWGEQYRDWVCVRDVVNACLLAGKATQSDFFNVGSGVASSFNDLVKMWNTILGTKRTPRYIDNPHTGAYQDFTLMDISKAWRCLEWKPQISLFDGMPLLHQYLTQVS